MDKNKEQAAPAAATVLTDERIEQVWEEVPLTGAFTMVEARRKFARAIEREVLAHAGVTAEPAGWKLVPIKLTPEMRAAWDKAPQNEDDDIEFAGAYQAMIDAAPTVPAQVPAAEVRAAYEQAAQVVDKLTEQTDLTYKAGILKTAARDIRSLAHQSTADKASEVRAAEWISVEDRLPQPGQLVLVMRYAGKVANSSHLGYPGKAWLEVSSTGPVAGVFACDLLSTGHVTYWMALPAAASKFPASPSTADSANTGALGEKGADRG